MQCFVNCKKINLGRREFDALFGSKGLRSCLATFTLQNPMFQLNIHKFRFLIMNYILKYYVFRKEVVYFSLFLSLLISCSTSPLGIYVTGGQSVEIDLLAGAVKTDSTKVQIINEPLNGELELVSLGVVNYKPQADFYGQDSFTYQRFDNSFRAEAVDVYITVSEPKLTSKPNQNNKPIAKAVSLRTHKDQPVAVVLEACDLDNDVLSYEITSEPKNGSLNLVKVTEYRYVPNSSFVGTDTFSYRGFDGKEYGGNATVTIVVEEEEIDINNQAPNINNQSFTVKENAAVNTLVGTVSGSDPENDTIRYEITSGNEQSVFSINANTGEVQLKQALNFEAKRSYPLQVKIIDAQGLSASATVTIQVSDVNYGSIIYAGDSITEGWGSLTDKGWPLMVDTALNKSFSGDFSSVTKGLDGDTAIGLNTRLTGQVLNQNPRFVTIQIGTNDVYDNSGVAPASTTSAIFEANIAKLLQSLKSKASIEQVFVLGIIAPVKIQADAVFPGLIKMTQAELDAKVSAYNTAMKRQAALHGFVFIDLAAQFPADANVRLPWIPDGVHPSEAGYNLIASSVEAQLRTKFN